MLYCFGNNSPWILSIKVLRLLQCLKLFCPSAAPRTENKTYAVYWLDYIIINFTFCYQIALFILSNTACANGNGRDITRLYRITFLDRRKPIHQTFTSVYRRVAQTECLEQQTMDRGRLWSARTPDQINTFYVLSETMQISSQVKRP